MIVTIKSQMSETIRLQEYEYLSQNLCFFGAQTRKLVYNEYEASFWSYGKTVGKLG